MYQPSSGVQLDLGRHFLPAADAVPPPFLQETISDDGVPAIFFGTGFGLSAPVNDNWLFKLSVTGKSGARFFSDDQFDRLDIAANLKRTIPNGYARVTVQKVTDTRLTFDVAQTYGPHEFRSAVHYQTFGEQLGGYLFYQNNSHQYLQPFVRVNRADDQWLGIMGMNTPINDNLDLTIEGRSDGTGGIKLRARF